MTYASSNQEGVIDDTHVHVKVPMFLVFMEEKTGQMKMILKNVFVRENPLVIPEGKYYLGDRGFMLKAQVITPYRGVRYHLKEYSQKGPQNARELFNHRHSSLRNAIKRTFGVLKKRFPIIASGTKPHYFVGTMTDIVLTCCIHHNFICGVDNDDSLLEEFDRDLMQGDINVSHSQTREDDYRLGSQIRDTVANGMWTGFIMDRGKGIASESFVGIHEPKKWTTDMDF
ncbi:protein ALP1-like [Phaseolus vulgaris]|uniref:protein ALP1-like n=1 Tax=Phaseolus vulgaris TaxID=3885 RepID=UPI0035CB0A8A